MLEALLRSSALECARTWYGEAMLGKGVVNKRKAYRTGMPSGNGNCGFMKLATKRALDVEELSDDYRSVNRGSAVRCT